MKKLTKQDIDRRDEITAKLREAQQEVEDQHAKVVEEVEALNEAIGKYNEVMDDAREFAEGIAGDIEMFMSEKSEKWLESERGEAYEAWRSEWEQVQLDNIDPVDPPDLPEAVHADDLEGVQEEVDG